MSLNKRRMSTTQTITTERTAVVVIVVREIEQPNEQKANESPAEQKGG